eukprot:1026990-Amorphochlora_amoeboformis.AAC.1
MPRPSPDVPLYEGIVGDDYICGVPDAHYVFCTLVDRLQALVDIAIVRCLDPGDDSFEVGEAEIASCAD